MSGDNVPVEQGDSIEIEVQRRRTLTGRHTVGDEGHSCERVGVTGLDILTCNTKNGRRLKVSSTPFTVGRVVSLCVCSLVSYGDRNLQGTGSVVILED